MKRLVPSYSLSTVIRKLRSGEKTIDNILFEFSELTYGDLVSVKTEDGEKIGTFLYNAENCTVILEDESIIFIRNRSSNNIKILKMSRSDRILELIQDEHLNSKFEDDGKRHIG